MGLQEELKRIDEEVKREKEERDGKKAEAANRKEQEERDKQRQEEYEQIRAILESEEEGIDEPGIYHIKERVVNFPHPSTSLSEYNRIMTERERRLILVSPGFGMSTVESIEPSDLSIEDLSEEEKLEYDAAKKKIELVKSSDEAEKRGIMEFKGQNFSHKIETSLKYALLSSINILNNGNFKTYEQIEEEKRAKEEKQIALRKEGKISFASIKKTILKVLGKER